MHAKVTAGTRRLTRDLRWCIGALVVLSLIFVRPVWAEPDATAPPEETALIQLFERVSPAVVSVVARQLPGTPPGPGQESRGSGFFIDREGHLLTTAHVLHQAAQIIVVRPDGQEVPARVMGRDVALNVALLQVAPLPETVPIPPLGDSSRVRVGQRAILIGNPLGLNQTMGLGIISGISPLMRTRTPFDPERVFETDIAIKSPQYTGSPVFDRQGEVIGLSQVIIDASRHLSFVLPINLVKEVLPELTTRGWVARPSLGVRGQIIDSQILELFKLPLVAGFLVEQVEARSPAALAGLQGGTLEVVVDGRRLLLGGDIITAVNGQRILTGADFARATASLKVGAALTISVFRRGQELDLGMQVAALPE